MTDREFLNAVTTHMTDEQARHTALLIKYLIHGASTENERKELFGLEGKTYDYARPQPWDDAMHRLNANPRFYIWMYEDGIAGSPTNLAELLITKANEVLKNLL